VAADDEWEDVTPSVEGDWEDVTPGKTSAPTATEREAARTAPPYVGSGEQARRQGMTWWQRLTDPGTTEEREGEQARQRQWAKDMSGELYPEQRENRLRSMGDKLLLGALPRGVAALRAIGGENYEDAKKEEFAKQATADANEPETAGMGVVGAIAEPVPGMGSLDRLRGLGGVAARLAAQGGYGALVNLAGGSDNQSPAERAAQGFGGGAAAGMVGEAFGGLSNRANAGVRRATADQAAIETGKAQKTLRKATSAMGGETAAIIHNYEMTAKVANSGPGSPFTPEQIVAAKARLADPAFQEVVRGAAQGALDEGAARLSGSYETAKNVRDTAAQASKPAAIEAATDKALENPLRTQLAPRIKRYAERAIPAAIGGTFGGPAGVAAGSIVSNTIGAPGTAASNAAKSPAVRKGAWDLLRKISDAGRSAAQQGPKMTGQLP
jgi:hypothetical protein